MNQLTPIDRVPPEVLLQIFSWATLIDKPMSRYLGWVQTVTHVCQLWRHIALESATLWTTIRTDMGTKWAEEMLRRSRSATVEIHHSSWSTLPWDDFLDRYLALPDNLQSIRVIDLRGQEQLLEYLSAPAPSLETLKIIHYDVFGVRPDNSLALPSNIFASHAPRLQEIYLSHCSIPWDSPIFHHNLILLTIHVQISETTPSVSQFEGLLRRTPILEELTIAHAIPSASSSRLRSVDPVVELLQLKVLSLCGDIPDMLQVLERVAIPPTTTLKLICHPLFDADLHHFEVIPILAARMDTPSYANLPLELRVTRQNVILRISLSAFMPVAGRSEPKLHNVFTLESHMDDIIPFLTALFQHLPRHRITSLFLDFSGCGPALFTDDVWSALFWRMRNVSHLELRNLLGDEPDLRSDAESLIPLDISRPIEHENLQFEPRRRRESDSDPAAAKIKRPIFPVLHTLLLSHIKIYRARERLVVGFLKKMARDMEWRRLSECAIEELIIEDELGALDEMIGTEEDAVVFDRLKRVVRDVRIVSGHSGTQFGI
ncbi:uncharacterized protein STEHIDRAFT_171490 [Stereum hirsutum FP-91666 SS1]|uniref:uncharacterized protein n=1 Tax=Stereum hirsutum (strain FP-91666) TaxID=721885 RepID=UPI0004449417|nr:uncharacterized protein STEHIDRAFT_171490 [Stereum hirsutum FP-91666 SS1]EIM81840.1 hypothetical protein STEHIDRAFT_171490 [Stereum hirsutum FP-91666 SS1]